MSAWILSLEHTGNLATSTSMELPMLKNFGGYQELWKGGYRDLFSMVLGEDIDEEPAEIDIELPPILDENTHFGPILWHRSTVRIGSHIDDLSGALR
jgi:hypothetical protein